MTRTVTDEHGTVHALEQPIGRGGQGTVYRVRGTRRVVKLLSGGHDREALRRQIAAVKRMELRDLHVARPLALLRAPDVGYVAELLEDMVPLRTLIAPPAGKGVTAWYLETGGLRRRLRLLAHAGEALGGIHAQGAIYGDVSHENVFVSRPVGAQEAWLIDLDNLRWESAPDDTLYTPGYGAPEIVAGSRGATSYSDAWAFAVLVYQTLTLVHPFCGDLVTEGEPELEEEAFAGRLPWVLCSTDDRNRSTRGIPSAAVLTEGLTRLAHDTFEAGLKDRGQRPSVGKWVDRLHRAADLAIRCEGCGGTRFARPGACPFCDSPRAMAHKVVLHRWEPGHGIVHMGARADGSIDQLPLASEPLLLVRRHTHTEVGVRARQETATIEQVDRGLHIRPAGGPLWITDPGKVEASAARPVPERGITLLLENDLSRSRVIHFGPPETPHVVATFSRGGR